MELTEVDFQHSVQDFKHRYPRGRGGDVWGLGIDFSFLLDQSPMIASIRVKKPMDDPHLIVVLCRVKSDAFSSQQLAGELKRLWTSEIWLPSFGSEAHTVAISDDEVRLEFVAVAHDRGRYVTGMITVSRQAKSRSG